MNIALIGYGRMGREVERVAQERGIKIVRRFDVAGTGDAVEITRETLKGVDVCIDFSSPESVVETITEIASLGKNLVVGTTGWYDRLDEVRQIVKKHGIGLLYASNFSLGVNIFMKIVMDSARLFQHHPAYDVAVSEVHHRGKSDAPSGTALSLGSVILKEFKRKSELLPETSHGKIKPSQLHVTSTRLGSVTGKHTVLFDSEADTIELTHTAKNRTGFALGAVVAAEWLKGKKGVYTMRDVLIP